MGNAPPKESKMSTTEIAGEVSDIRMTTLCHHMDQMMNDNRMTSSERVGVGIHAIATIVRGVPKDDRIRWLAHAIKEICDRSAELDLVPISVPLLTRKV